MEKDSLLASSILDEKHDIEKFIANDPLSELTTIKFKCWDKFGGLIPCLKKKPTHG